MLRTLIDDFIQLSKNKSVREFVVKCGYTKNEDLQITDGRDTFINIDNKVYTKEDSYYFNFCTESALIPNTGIFQKIIEEKFNDVMKLNIVLKNQEWASTLTQMQMGSFLLTGTIWTAALMVNIIRNTMRIKKMCWNGLKKGFQR